MKMWFVTKVIQIAISPTMKKRVVKVWEYWNVIL